MATELFGYSYGVGSPALAAFLEPDAGAEFGLSNAIANWLLRPFLGRQYEVCGICVAWAAPQHETHLADWIATLGSTAFLEFPDEQLLTIPAHYAMPQVAVRSVGFHVQPKPITAETTFQLPGRFGLEICKGLYRVFIRHGVEPCPLGMIFAMAGLPGRVDQHHRRAAKLWVEAGMEKFGMGQVP